MQPFDDSDFIEDYKEEEKNENDLLDEKVSGLIERFKPGTKSSYVYKQIFDDVKSIVKSITKLSTFTIDSHDGEGALVDYINGVHKKLQDHYVFKNNDPNENKYGVFIKDFMISPFNTLSNYISENPNNFMQGYDVKSDDFANVFNNEIIIAGNRNLFGKTYGKDKVTEIDRTFYSKAKGADGKALKERINDLRGGWFERTFRTTSPEYNKLTKLIENFGQEEFVNSLDLKLAAKDYIKHKLPSYDINDDSKPFPDYSNLKPNEKARIEMCKDILRAHDEANQQYKLDHNLIKNDNQNNIIDNQKENIIIDEANDLSNDLSNSENDLSEEYPSYEDEKVYGDD